MALISLLHIPAHFLSLDSFDAIKRAGWIVLFVLLYALAWRQPVQAEGRLRLAWLGLAGWMILRSLLRPNPGAEFGVMLTWLLPLVAFSMAWRIAPGFNVKAWAWILWGTGLAQSALMISQYFGSDPLFGGATATLDHASARMIGAIGYHNQAADFLALCIPAVFVLHSRWLMRAVLSAPLLLAIGFTASRGAAAGVLLAVTVAAVVDGLQEGPRRPYWWRWPTAFLLLAAVLLFTSPNARQRMSDMAREGRHNPALASRLVLNQLAIGMWSERPVAGWGAGEFSRQYMDRLADTLPPEKTHDILRSVTHVREAHHDFAQFLAEFGLIGAILLGVLAACWFRDGILARNGAHLQLPGMYVLVYMAVSSSVSFTWQTALAGPLAGFWLGCCSRRAPPEGPRGERLWGVERAGMLIMLAGMAIGFFWSLGLALFIPASLERGSTDRAIDFIPPWGHSYRALCGAALAAEEQWEEAERELIRAREGYQDALLLNNLGHVLAAQGRWPEAAAIYERWAASGIDHATALNNLSIARQRGGDFYGAAEAQERKLALWPERDVAALSRLIALYHRAGHAAHAVRVFEQLRPRMDIYATELPPDTLRIVGVSYRQTGQEEQARYWLEWAGNKEGLEGRDRD